MIRFIGFAITGASFLSAFLWAAFDISWWVPAKELSDPRMYCMFLLHFVGLFAAAFAEVFR